jgi:hypothetical protein
MSRMATSLARHRWTLQRFGLAPPTPRYRIAGPTAPRILCVSIPKAGTHLLERALCLHPLLYRKIVPTVSGANIERFGGLDALLHRVRPGQVIVSHLRFDPDFPKVLLRRGVRGIFLVRDPRDIVVSEVHYICRSADHRHHDLFAGLPDMKQRLRLAIAGDPAHDVASIAERLDAFRGWLESGCLVVRFEDLVGPDGGGDRPSQLAAVRSVFHHLEVDADERLVESVCARLFSATSPTFRRGTIGAWRHALDPELQSLFSGLAGEAVRPYPYRLSDAGAPA